MLKMIFLFLILSFFSCSKPAIQGKPEETPVIQANELPSLRLTLSDRRKLTARELGGKTILVLFQPDCDHCQREAEQFGKLADSFRGYNVYFISSVPVGEVIKFGEKYGLAGKQNFFFAETPVDDVLNSFGPIETPSVYIYSAERKLIQSFNGEVAVEVIIKYL